MCSMDEYLRLIYDHIASDVIYGESHKRAAYREAMLGCEMEENKLRRVCTPSSGGSGTAAVTTALRPKARSAKFSLNRA